MAFPQPNEYNAAIQNLRSTMSDAELREGEAAVNALGMPMPSSGNFADVYKVHCPATGNTWAVKCFTREVAGLKERYRGISEHLEKVPFGFMVEFHYVEPGIRIGKQSYPFLKMRWVEGLRLNQFVCDYLDKPKTLHNLLPLWLRLSDKLRKAKIAHGDLQHGNVLLVPVPETGQLSLKLIDYDGMYVPALAKTKSGEVGHPCFQHPQRIKEAIYNADVDRFSHLAIYTAIQAVIAGKRELWDKFDNGDNLLFRESDFKNPETSELFRRLWETPSQAELHALVGRLILACKRPLNQCPHLDELVFNGVVLPLTPELEEKVRAMLGAAGPAAQAPSFNPSLGGMLAAPPIQAPAASSPGGVTPQWTAAPAAPAYPLAAPGLADLLNEAVAPLSAAQMPAFRPRKRFRLKKLGVLPVVAASLAMLGFVAVVGTLAYRGGAASRENPSSGLASSSPSPAADPGAARPVQPAVAGAPVSPSGVRPGQSDPAAPTSSIAATSPALENPSNPALVPPMAAENTADESAASKWQPKLRLAFPRGKKNSPLILADGSGQFLFDGFQVTDATTGKSVGKLQDGFSTQFTSWALRALSPDGHLYAVVHKGSGLFGDGGAVAILSSETAEPVGEVEMPHDRIGIQSAVQYVGFLNPDELLLIHRHSAENGAWVCNMTTRKVTKKFSIGDFSAEMTAISPNGEHFLTGTWDGGIQVYDVKKGKPVCQLAMPTRNTPFSDLKGIEFSPDGSQIAACCEGRVVSWNAHGDIEFDYAFSGDTLSQLRGHTGLVWLPDGSGWFVADQYLVLREPKVVVWEVDGNENSRFGREAGPASRFLSKDELLLIRNNIEQREFAVIPVPWELIHHALEAMEPNRAFFRPGDNVQIDLHVGPLTTQNGDVPRHLTEALAGSLGDYNLVQGAPRTVRACYAEVSGNAQSVMIDGVPFALPPLPANVTVSGSRGCLFVQYLVADKSEPVWKAAFDSVRPVSAGVTAAPRSHVLPLLAAVSAAVAAPTFAQFGPRRIIVPRFPMPAPGQPFAPRFGGPPAQPQAPNVPGATGTTVVTTGPLVAILQQLKNTKLPVLVPKDPKAPCLPIVTTF